MSGREIVTPSVPFSNGSEERAWMAKWCAYCDVDHPMHPGGSEDAAEACLILLNYLIDPKTWPEAWLPEPDDGRFFMPSRMCCAMFRPCTSGGCSGDPGAEERAERVVEVTAYWRNRNAEVQP